MRIGTTELIILLIVVIIIFGPTQIPKLTKMFGKSVKSFKDGMEEKTSGGTVEDEAAPKTQKAEAGRDDKASDEDES